MRICRFDNHRLGIVEGDQVFDVTPALEIIPPARYPRPRQDPLIAKLVAVRA
jgi:hypothetical protein